MMRIYIVENILHDFNVGFKFTSDRRFLKWKHVRSLLSSLRWVLQQCRMLWRCFLRQECNIGQQVMQPTFDRVFWWSLKPTPLLIALIFIFLLWIVGLGTCLDFLSNAIFMGHCGYIDFRGCLLASSFLRQNRLVTCFLFSISAEGVFRLGSGCWTVGLTDVVCIIMSFMKLNAWWNMIKHRSRWSRIHMWSSAS